jgi:lysine-specific demethylase/histidyl-hydroxylase NO66
MSHATPLARLTADPEEFRERWPAKPQVHRGDPAWARSLLTSEAIDTLIAEYGLDASRITMADGDLIPARHYSAGDAIDPIGLGERLRDGATLLLQSLHTLHPPLVGLCRETVAELGHPVQANAYLTPPRSNGFAHHWDGHSSFLIQTEGSKNWQIFEPIVEDPMTPGSIRSGQLSADFADREPLLEIELHIGDVLWLPRGWIHNGVTADEWSLHVTIGIKQFTSQGLLASLLRAASEEPALRAALPPGTGLDETVLRQAMTQSRRALINWLEGLSDGRLAALVTPGVQRTLGGPARRPVTSVLAGPTLKTVRVVPYAILSVAGSGRLRFGDADVDVLPEVLEEYDRAHRGDGVLDCRRLTERIGAEAAKEAVELLLTYGAVVPIKTCSERDKHMSDDQDNGYLTT